jgi:hypothetical protein
MMYYNGQGTAQDRKRAFEYFNALDVTMLSPEERTEVQRLKESDNKAA